MCDRLKVHALPTAEQIVGTDATRMPVDLLCVRTGNNITVDLPVDFLIKIRRLLLTRSEINLDVRKVRKVRYGETVQCDAEVNHQYEGR